VYGRTKAEGEEVVSRLPHHWTFRVPVLFGPGKANFVSKGLDKLQRGEEYVVASDQVACAANTLDMARVMMEVIEARSYGLYHIANAGACSRLELILRAAEIAALDAAHIVAKPTDEMKRRAKRLKYSVMELRALKQAGFSEPRRWEDALQEYVGKWKRKE
jgi:dTDP-4-dehydrorhamnose reductase